MMRLFKNEAGFTLIEILIVVLIIAIIAALAIPNLLAAQQASWGNTCIANRATIVTAAELWRVHSAGTAPAAIGNLTVGVVTPGGFVHQPVLTALPNCPETGTMVYALLLPAGGPIGATCANQLAGTHP